uniref:arylamine N-acetyltransferase n=2 Tax=Lygus hesperus TaxID=30085 RepID=A0A0A9XEB6_LYGHE
MMCDKDLQLWLKLTGADEEIKIGDTPDLPLLKKLVKYQLKEVFYQNYDLLLTRKEFDLTPTALLQRMLVEGRRGMCFEACEMMALVLIAFKFDARRTPVFCTVNGQVYQEGAVLDHNVIIVYLDGKKYLIDVIFSFNSIREPLEFSFEQTEERTVIPDVEKYRLEVHGDHCMLHMWLKETGAKCTIFHYPFNIRTSSNIRKIIAFFLLLLPSYRSGITL